MKRIAFLLVAVAMVAGVAAFTAPATGHSDEQAAPIFGIKIYPGYREWKLVSVAHEEGNLNDIRAILGNDIAIKACRQDKLLERVPEHEGSSTSCNSGNTDWFPPGTSTD